MKETKGLHKRSIIYFDKQNDLLMNSLWLVSTDISQGSLLLISRLFTTEGTDNKDKLSDQAMEIDKEKYWMEKTNNDQQYGKERDRNKNS